MKKYKVKIISEDLKRDYSIKVETDNKTHAMYLATDYVLEDIKLGLMFKVKKL